MYEIKYNEELSHHGIVGQKWGHRNGPPYPLDASAHSKAEKEAMASKSGSSGSGSDSKSSKSSSSDNIAAGKKFVADSTKSGWDDLSADDKIAIIELGVVTTAMVVSATANKIHEVKETKRLTKKLDDMYENREFKTLADVPKLNKKMSAEESMKVVNPDFPEEGSVQNCMLCTTAMIMREKGYDVKANKIDEGIFEKNLDKAFDGPNTKFKQLRVNDTDKIYDKLAKEGDGAYGNLTVQFWLGGGHSVFWKVENGEARIYDAQSGEEYKRNAKMDETNMMAYVNPSFVKYNRCDNAEPTEYVLGLVNSGSSQKSNLSKSDTANGAKGHIQLTEQMQRQMQQQQQQLLQQLQMQQQQQHLQQQQQTEHQIQQIVQQQQMQQQQTDHQIQQIQQQQTEQQIQQQLQMQQLQNMSMMF